jgi:hypothetical protein
MAVAVIDIDGVVADVRHRLHHLGRLDGRGSGRKNWPAFFAGAADDSLLEDGARVARELANSHDIVWLTGRPEELRDVTEQWLARHELPTGALVMRPAGDRRPARVFKLGALRRLASNPRGDIAVVIDDDPEVLEAARAAGYVTFLADWVPRSQTVLAPLHEAQERYGRT